MKQHKPLFKWRHVEPTIILLSVRWYWRYQLSYRDLEEMMRERCLSVDHTTIFRWVQRYAPEINKRMRQHLKMSGTAQLSHLFSPNSMSRNTNPHLNLSSPSCSTPAAGGA